MSSKTMNSGILPVLFAFFVMGFCDVVGISTSYVQHDFGLTETQAGFLPSMVFLWFLFLSIPTALFMNRIGRKNTVLVSMVVTFVGMLIPFISYTLFTCMLGFIFLGIGNTILQVSLNPLLTNVVKGDKLTSYLTTGQVVKAVSSFCGPLIAGFALTQLHDWKYLFPIFAVITLISGLWLLVSHIEKEDNSLSETKTSNPFLLLKDKTIFFLFLGIVFVVGTDVGMNTLSPKLLIERCGVDLAASGVGSSVYFAFRTAGALLGAILLTKIPEMKYFKVSIAVAVIALAGLIFAQEWIVILIVIAVIGFACASIFAIIYSMAIQRQPTKANEISGLMITGVAGGAIIPPLMGFATDKIGSQVGSIIIIGVCMVYLVYCAYGVKISKV